MAIDPSAFIEMGKKGVSSDAKGYYEMKNIIDDKKKDIVIIKNEINRLKVLCSDKFNIKEMHLENLNKVFEPKFTTKTSGMGLGLAMVKKIVETYNGSITLESNENEHTIFKVTFPKS